MTTAPDPTNMNAFLVKVGDDGKVTCRTLDIAEATAAAIDLSLTSNLHQAKISTARGRFLATFRFGELDRASDDYTALLDTPPSA